MTHKGPALRIDWLQVMLDLQRRGYTVQAVASQIAVPKATLMGWKNLGAEPRYADGERLLAFWARVMERLAAEAPRTHAPEWLR